MTLFFPLRRKKRHGKHRSRQRPQRTSSYVGLLMVKNPIASANEDPYANSHIQTMKSIPSFLTLSLDSVSHNRDHELAGLESHWLLNCIGQT